MLELNYNTRIIDSKNTLDQWRRRMLTPVGSLTVIKTLVEPTINHLKLTHPHPDKVFLNNFETEIYTSIFGMITSIKSHWSTYGSIQD